MNKASALPRFFPFVLFALLLVFFSYDAFRLHFMLDDFEFSNALRDKNTWESSLNFYNLYNGRLASHLFLNTVIFIFRDAELLLFLYRFAMLAAFIFSLAFLLRNYLSAFRDKSITKRQSYFFAAFITSFLYFFFFAAKVEVWIWVSSTGVYLISLILAMNAFALLLCEKQTLFRKTLIAFLFFLAGGFSESFAVMYALLLIYFSVKFIHHRPGFTRYRFTVIFALAGIIAGLALNFSAGGAHNRLEWLPDFRLLYAMKNTVHSLAFPLLRYEFLPITLLLVAGFFMYAHYCFRAARMGANYFLKRAVPVLIFIAISFFLPCYVLSDIVPDRAATLGYFAGVLFLFDYFIFRG